MLGWTLRPGRSTEAGRSATTTSANSGTARARADYRSDGPAHDRVSTPRSAAGRSLTPHARSGDPIATRQLPRLAAAGFDEALASFAETYADQNELDFAALQQAAAEARIPVISGL